MNDFINNIITDLMASEITTTGAVGKMLLSLVLGAAVGYERKRRGQIAGVRTFALISMGATLAMILSIYVPQEYLGLKNGDPGRIAAQVVTGIGFLGAGAIIQMKGSVRGLTTAAGIWMVAAIGMAVGAGLYAVAIVSTILIFFTLILFERYERSHNLVRETKALRIEVREVVQSLESYRQMITDLGVKVMDESLRVDYDETTSTVMFLILLRDINHQSELFAKLHSLPTVKSITISNEIDLRPR